MEMNRQLKLRDGQRLADEDYDTLVHCLFTAIHCGYSHHVSTILDMAQDSSAVASAEHTVNDQIFVPILTACEKGQVDIVRMLLRHGAGLSLLKLNKNHCNGLHAACLEGNVELARIICEHVISSDDFTAMQREKFLNERSKDKWTPLMYAVDREHTEVVNFLTSLPDVRFDSINQKRHNVFHLAVNNIRCLCALHTAAKPSVGVYLATDKGKWGILHWVCAKGNLSVLKWLLSLRYNDQNALAPTDLDYSEELPMVFFNRLNDKTEKGYTPLLVACEYQKKDIVEYLLDLKEHVDPTACTGISEGGITPEGNTGLHLAALHDAPDIAQLLIDYKCPLDVQDSQGNTALHIARKRASFKTADVIKNGGAQVLRNKAGQTPDIIEPEDAVPLEIKRRGSEAEKIYRIALSDGKQKMPRCNLLVLGEERVGKTSLIRQLIGKPFIPNLETTYGIENTRVKTVAVATIATNNENEWTTINESDQDIQHLELICSTVATKIEEKEPNFFDMHPKIEQSSFLSEDNLHKCIQQIEKKYQYPPQPRAKTSCATRQILTPPLVHSIPATTSAPKKDHKEVNVLQYTPATRPYQNVKNAPQPQTITAMNKIPPIVVPGSSSKDQKQLASKKKSDSKIMFTRRESIDISKRLKSSKKVKPALIFNTLDFAGQKGYRPMHHCFISSQAMFIVVCNLKSLVQENCNGKNSAIEELHYWLNSIHGHTRMHSVQSKALAHHDRFVFIVGTHKADITAAQIDEINVQLNEQLSNKRYIFFYKRNDCDYIFAAVENSFDQFNQRQESGIEDLKKELLKASESLPFLKVLRPISWLRYENALHQKRKQFADTSIAPIMNLQDVTELAKQCGVDEVDEIHIALQFFHDTGTIIYPRALSSLFLNEEERKQLADVILIDAQWLIHLMKDLMEIKMSDKTSCTNKEIRELQRTGKTTTSCLKSCWKKQFDVHVYKFMQAYGLICPINNTSAHEASSIDQGNEFYLVPCMLPDEVKRYDGIPRPALVGYYFVFDFKSFLPEEVFFRFICLVLKKSQAADPQYSRRRCVIFKMNNSDWDITFNSEKHILQVTVCPEDGHSSVQCITYLDQEYMRPICHESGLQGLEYVGGPELLQCKNKCSAGVLCVVSYPATTSGNGESGTCEECRTPYPTEDIFKLQRPLTNQCLQAKAEGLGDKTLKEKDLRDVLSAVIDVAAKWEEFGTALGIIPSDLEVIQQKRENSDQRLREVLLTWLRQRYDVKKFGPPTWKNLCGAVRSKIGADNPALAMKIEETIG